MGLTRNLRVGQRIPITTLFFYMVMIFLKLQYYKVSNHFALEVVELDTNLYQDTLPGFLCIEGRPLGLAQVFSPVWRQSN